VARELGETSLVFLMHPTRKDEDTARACEVVRQIMQSAVR